jgi:hypothetical protein
MAPDLNCSMKVDDIDDCQGNGTGVVLEIHNLGDVSMIT